MSCHVISSNGIETCNNSFQPGLAVPNPVSNIIVVSYGGKALEYLLWIQFWSNEYV